MVEISVVIPCYNQARFLSDALKRVGRALRRARELSETHRHVIDR